MASTSTILDLASGSEITLGDGLGTILIEVDDTTTAAITETSGVYDLEMISPAPDNEVTRLFKGSVTFDPEVTR